MLQNHFGERDLPVRPRWRYAKAVRLLRLQHDRNRASLVMLGRFVPAIVICVALYLAWGVLPGLPDALRDGDSRIIVAALAFFAVTLLITLLGELTDTTLPMREQRRYRDLGAEGGDPTPAQQAMLALDAQSDHSYGGWNSSLDYQPSWRTLPADVRRTWEHRSGRRLFLTLPLLAVAQARADLDERFHVASAQDLELLVADVLAGAGYSGRFSEVLAGEDGERMLSRLASLTGEDEWSLRELDEERDGRPAERLRGGDVQRLVTVVRMAYVAEHIDAATAWRLIERSAEAAFAAYDGWDAYWRSVRRTVAFASDRVDQVQWFDESLRELRTSTWPAARVPWPETAPAPRRGAIGEPHAEDATH